MPGILYNSLPNLMFYTMFVEVRCALHEIIIKKEMERRQHKARENKTENCNSPCEKFVFTAG